MEKLCSIPVRSPSQKIRNVLMKFKLPWFLKINSRRVDNKMTRKGNQSVWNQMQHSPWYSMRCVLGQNNATEYIIEMFHVLFHLGK